LSRSPAAAISLIFAPCRQQRERRSLMPLFTRVVCASDNAPARS